MRIDIDDETAIDGFEAAYEAYKKKLRLLHPSGEAPTPMPKKGFIEREVQDLGQRLCREHEAPIQMDAAAARALRKAMRLAEYTGSEADFIKQIASAVVAPVPPAPPAPAP